MSLLTHIYSNLNYLYKLSHSCVASSSFDDWLSNKSYLKFPAFKKSRRILKKVFGRVFEVMSLTAIYKEALQRMSFSHSSPHLWMTLSSRLIIHRTFISKKYNKKNVSLLKSHLIEHQYSSLANSHCYRILCKHISKHSPK